MNTSEYASATGDCSLDPQPCDSKSLVLAAQAAEASAGARVEKRFAKVREIFRSPQAVQAMEGVEAFATGGDADQTPIIFLDGEPHRRRRSATARYFTPKAITTRYSEVIHRSAERLIAELREKGSGELDIIAFRMAVEVTAEVVGLTESEREGQAERLRNMLDSDALAGGWLKRKFKTLLFAYRMQRFYAKDVAPAIASRRLNSREDIITHMVRENYTKRAMLIECLIYGTAGMVTTRELITMAAWHMFENHGLRQRFLDGTEDEQTAIIDEVLRLEPVAAMLYRWMPSDDTDAERERIFLDIRSANLDEEVAGECPLLLDPDRAKKTRVATGYMSFGDGPHRCPGAQLALFETRVFLDKLMRVPGIRLERAPQMRWYATLMSYELRKSVISCDPA